MPLRCGLSSRPCHAGSDPSLLLLAAVLAAGCSGGDDTAGTTTGADTGTTTVAAPSTSKITLRAGRTNTGPWVESLALEHGPDGVPTNFFVCAAWDEPRPPRSAMRRPGATLPADTVLRLEQRPVGAAAASPDSPGWATVGTSDVAELEVPLSDFVSGLAVDGPRTASRCALAPAATALATSNPITVTWSVAAAVRAGRTPRARASRPRRAGLRRRRERDRRATAGHALTPARIRVRQASFPSAAANA